MRLCEQFIKINPRYNDKVISFIKGNCPKVQTMDELRGIGLPIEGLVVRTGCDGCNLCKKSVFIKNRNYIKNIADELESTNIVFLPEKLSNIADKYLNIKMRIGEDSSGSYKLKLQYDNLWQLIIADLVKHFNYKLNKIYSQDVYFLQIAEILVSTKKFIKDVKNLKLIYDNYLEALKNAWTDNDFFVDPKTSKSAIYKELQRLMDKYLLSDRWGMWMEQFLHYDLKKNKKNIFRYIPNGRIIKKKKKIIEDGIASFVDEPVIVGDETESELRIFQETYNIDINLNNPSRRRRPILEFEKQFRWYRMREDGKSYIDIIDYELNNHLKDWWEFKEYKEHKDDDSTILPSGREKAKVERMIINRIKSGLHKLNERIYEEIK